MTGNNVFQCEPKAVVVNGASETDRVGPEYCLPTRRRHHPGDPLGLQVTGW